MATESGFQLEREMQVNARNWLTRQGLLIKEEFNTPWGICDFVALSFSQNHIKQRLSLGQRLPIGPPIRIALLNRIPDTQTGKAITHNRLRREFANFLTAGELQNEIDCLIKNRFVLNTRRNSYQKLNGWVPLHRKILALELKLKRVEEAFAQALSHLRFATHSYVGFPIELAMRVMKSSRCNDFVREGIGIVGVGLTDCELLLEAKNQSNRPKDNIIQIHCTERFWRSIIKGN